MLAPDAALPDAPLVLIDVETEGGQAGRAYLFAYQRWALAPLVGCVEGLGEMLVGQPADPAGCRERIDSAIQLLDRSGLVAIAASGLDQCVWDASARHAGVPLVEHLGGQRIPVRAYESAGFWWWTPPEGLAEEARAAADAGFRGMKMRLGRADPHDDLAAVRAVRGALDDNVAVMADYLQLLRSPDDALARLQMLDDEGLEWIEDPLPHLDHTGYRELGDRLSTPIQGGENLGSAEEAERALAAGVFDRVMPDIQRLGVSGWRRVAAAAAAHDVPVSNHMFAEHSVHLLAATPNRDWLERMDLASGVVLEPLQIADGHAVPPDRPGAGIEWDEAAVDAQRVA